MSQRDNDNLNDQEELEISESEMEEGLDQMEKWRKCNNFNRPCNGHGGATGAKCELEPPETQTSLKEYYKELKEKLKGKKKKNKTPRKETRQTGVIPAPGVSGTGLGDPTTAMSTPNNITMGAGGQVMIDPGLLQQLVIALQSSPGINLATGGHNNSPGLDNRRGSNTNMNQHQVNQQWNGQQFQQQQFWNNQQYHQGGNQQQGGFQQQQPGYHPPPHQFFMQPTSVPKFHKTMTGRMDQIG